MFGWPCQHPMVASTAGNRQIYCAVFIDEIYVKVRDASVLMASPAATSRAGTARKR